MTMTESLRNAFCTRMNTVLIVKISCGKNLTLKLTFERCYATRSYCK